MTDILPLKTAGIITGTFLLLLHIPAFLWKDNCHSWLQKFPRSKMWGIILLAAATLWTFLLVIKMDLGEFARLRSPIAGFVLLAALLTWRFLDEFLAVRSLGILALLAAQPILDACFLQAPLWRLLLVILAYIWIVAGLLWVGMPYLLRDQTAWVSASSFRWNFAVGLGIASGILILACAIFAAAG
ncbi:MAG: hypothetical protein C5B47_02870 [Verrucomicrobia bacterium]|nr:MAG: hypothetical protein C5B47_02870 [Verrucomicrobiota bacterium]